MIDYPRISPEILTLGPLKIRWYGMMYIVAYVLGFSILKKRAQRGLVRVNYRACELWISYMVVSMLLGARLAYVFIYNWAYYSQHIIELFYVWEGGLSFHGAIVGMSLGCYFFAKRFHLPFFEIADCLAFCGTPGLFFGRMGNFINGELYGRPSSVAWAMIFPRDTLQTPRHPSQLYEAFTEGLLMFLILWSLQKWLLKKHKFRSGIVASTFLLLYGILRFAVEFTREPDAQLGLVLGPFSMGQILCFLMILSGSLFLFWILKKQALWAPQPSSEKFLEEEKPASLLTHH